MLPLVEIPNKVIEIIFKFIKEAKIDNINIEQAILFGSYAKGTQNKYSDIDLAVVSADFEGNRFKDNLKLAEAKLRTSIDLETHPFRIQDFSIDNLFVKEILKEGIRLV